MLALCLSRVECRLFHWHSWVGRGTERSTIKCVSSVHMSVHAQNSWSILDHLDSLDRTSYICIMLLHVPCLKKTDFVSQAWYMYSHGFFRFPIFHMCFCNSTETELCVTFSILFINDVWFVVQQEVIRLGGEVELAELGLQHGANVNLPPVLLGILGKDPSKQTVSSYRHKLVCNNV